MSSPTWPADWLRRAEAGRVGRRRRAAAPAGTVAIGSGDTAGTAVASKAALLDRAARVGIDVPDGLVVLDGAPADQIAEAIGAWARDRGLGGVAVRSAFGSEDGATSSRAGWYRTELDVGVDDVGPALARVRGSADDQVRTDTLVMAMVEARHAGVAFSEPGTYDDVVNVIDGLADRLVSGEREGERVVLPRLESEPADSWQRRLQVLLRSVRRRFGDRPWDVEWADDGATCWLVQLRPITAPTVRNELLTLANHAEILPELPSTLMTSVIREAGPDLFAWYRRRVRGLPADRDFLHVVAGRPMINMSLLEDMMRHLGLPTALIAESIGGEPGVDRPLAPARLVRRSPGLVRLGLAQIAAVLFARRNERRVARIGHEGADDIRTALAQLHDAYVTLVTGMFPLSSAIGPPLSVLRRAGTLLDHASTHRTITAELSERLVELRSGPSDATDGTIERFLADFGHRGVYESDIARPRFRDDTDRLLSDVTTPSPPSATAHRPTARGWRWWATRPLWWVAARPLAARERYRHEAMRSFATIRDSLSQLAQRAEADGALPSADALWLLDVDQACSIDEGIRFDQAFVDAALAERAAQAALHPPHVVRRFDDPAAWGAGAATAERWTGLPLTTGAVRGRAWVLREPTERLPAGFEPAETVLVARSIDAGWVTTLPLVAAVAVEIGGDLSHGSILVREVGIPAITNARGITSGIATGDAVHLDAGTGSVTLLPS